MHAKTPFLSQTRLPDAAIPDPAPADEPLSAAFGKVLGGQQAKPHLAGAAGKTATSALKAEKTSGPAHDRVAAVKQIGPRSGHR
jgi:hypothetical protein